VEKFQLCRFFFFGDEDGEEKKRKERTLKERRMNLYSSKSEPALLQPTYEEKQFG
jgi:hypothetical protein